MRIEDTILKHLFHDESYARKVLPYIKSEYFHDPAEKKIFIIYSDLFNKYNDFPSFDSIEVTLNEDTSISEHEFDSAVNIVENLKNEPEKTSHEWLLDNTEKFCQDKAVYNGIMDSIQILDGHDKNRDKGEIPGILTNALAVSFDNNIGHDFLEHADERFEYYHEKLQRVPFDIDILNTWTKGGVPTKSLTVFMAGTGVGKSLAMSHLAAGQLLDGKNVLYITMELSQEEVAKRIDANMLNTELDDLDKIPKHSYEKKINRIKGKTSGKLVIKEFPTGGAHCGHFRHLLHELALKKNFEPDIIYIDYINICLSSRVRMSSNVNSYTYVKAIAEEIRGLAIEKNVPIISATQLNRGGSVNSDPGLEDTSESFGLPQTVDAMFAMISNDDLAKLGQIMLKQLKNRWGDLTHYPRWNVGIDGAKMRLYDLDSSAQEAWKEAKNDKKEKQDEAKAVMDSGGAVGEALKAEKDKIAGFKF